MQSVSTAYKDAYAQAHSLRSLPRVIFEWNYNRIAAVVTPSNAGNKKEDSLFPISSIANSVRGNTGLIKARAGEARTYKSSSNTAPQYRTVGARSNYKYWTSTTQSSGTKAITGVTPQVVYGASVLTNKIVIASEISWAKPSTWTVSITTNGTTWTQVASSANATIDSKGRIVLYRQANGTWSNTVHRDAETNIRGVRFNVTAMSQPNAHANIIEVSGRLEKNLSDYVISASTSRSTDEPSLVFPVGQISSNTASVTLDNTNEYFDRDNTSSPYYGLMENNTKVTVEYGTDVSAFGGGFEYVKQGEYYVDSWNSQTSQSTVDVEMSDTSKFFQQIMMHPVLYVRRTPGQIIAEILSSVGFNNYAIDIANDEKQARVPYAWFTSEDTVWDAIQSICNSTQGTMYSDENGVMRYVSRDKTFENAADTPDFAIYGEASGTTLPNMESMDVNYNVEANKVIVNYTPLIANSRKIPVDRQVELRLPGLRTRRITRREYDTVPIDSVLWKPENTVTLRASQLQKSLTATDTVIEVPNVDATAWPWKGTVNIEGEIMTYEGKQYRWWMNGQEQMTNVMDKEQQNNIDDMKSDLGTRHKNYYTGRLVNVKRGQMGTVAAAHSRDLSSWHCKRKDPNGAVGATPVRMKQEGSQMVLWGYPGDSLETYTYALREYFTDDYKVYGTRLRFTEKNYRDGTAGMFWQLQGDNKQGYYVEINLSSHAYETLKGSVGEIRVYRMFANGTRKALPHVTNNAFGWTTPVLKNQSIDVEVTSTGAGTYAVYVNGILRTSFTDPDGTLPPGTWGTFIRGHTVAEFEYFYVANTADGYAPEVDSSSFQHKVNGSFVSGLADREKSRRSAYFLNWYFDDFGPWVHEMRKFQVEFDKVPALDAHVYLSNTWDAYILEGNRTAFDASFWIANSGRDNAVLNGDDPTVYVGGGDVKQQLLVYGQLVTEDEDSSVNTEQEGIYKSDTSGVDNSITYSNEYAIRKRGVVELTVDSKWIQSRSQAESLGRWIVQHWSEPVDNVSVTGFFNPAIQLGDVVSINYPSRNILASKHRYHVVGIEFGFDGGITTSLTLRRIR